MKDLDTQIEYFRSIAGRARLLTADTYDVWMTRLGYRVKDLYNRHPRRSLVPAAALTLFDLYLNNRARVGYAVREYPIVRAWVALTCMQSHALRPDETLLADARRHIDWLLENPCVGYSGPCWGLGFEYAVSAAFQYDANTPLTTMTPYALEAMTQYEQTTGDGRYADAIRGVYTFFEHDVPVLEETESYLVTAYSTMRDRRVVNAVSYAMFAYTQCLPWLDAEKAAEARAKISKLYAFVVSQQRADGAWLYSPDGDSFIDCFHSCIVLKNIIKTAADVPLPNAERAVEDGYQYLKSAFYVPKDGLFKRFTKSNKPSLIAYDLYDNAEVLNLAALLEDWPLVDSLRATIADRFCGNDHIYSQIDRFGVRLNPDQLRWAVMPYLYGLSVAELRSIRRGAN